MAKSIYPTEIILKMNSRLFLNALEGVTEDQAKKRISNNTNPLNWLIAHTIWARYNMCKLLGKSLDKNPYEGLFENFKSFDPSLKYQTLSENKAEWQKATKLLTEALADVTEEHLASEGPFKNPIGDFTFGGSVAFLTQHESYNIGQMAFLKKYFTNEGMKY